MMTFPEAASTDLDPCPVHTERLSFDVVGARHRHFAYIFALWNTTSCLFLVDRNIHIHILAWKCLRLHAKPRSDPNMLHFMLEGKPKPDSMTKGEHSANSNTKFNSHCQQGAGE